LFNPTYRGHLTIQKVYKNKTRDTIFVDHNIVVDGMGYGLSRLFSNDGSSSLEDFKINYFQIGTSSVPNFGDPGFYSLSAPISSYGNHSNIETDTHNQITAATEFVDSPVLSETANVVFGEINQEFATIIQDSGIAFQIKLDENTANGKDISEIGLFMGNPNGTGEESSILVAYRNFGPYSKTSDFELVFNWIIEGIDCEACVFDPTFGDVYYGLSSVPEASRRQSQFLDIFSPRDLSSPRAAVVWFHAGGLTGGTRKNFDPFFAQKVISRGMHFIAPDYAVATSGGVNGGGIPVDFPIFTSGQGFGTSNDSSAALIPSSTQPFRLPGELENAFTDGLRIIQFLKYNATEYNIDPDLIIVVGGAAGGDISSWLGFAPEVSSSTGTSDAVEEESSRVFANATQEAITDWVSLIPWGLEVFNSTQSTVPTGKTVYDMSGAVWVPSGEGFTQTSSPNYASGDHFSPNLFLFPEHVKYSMGIMMGSSISVAKGGPNITPFHDWTNIAGLRANFEFMQVPLIAKQYWSARYHCSGVGNPVPSTSANIGHVDNSGVYTWAGATGLSSSALGLSAVPNWKFRLKESNKSLLVSSIPTGLVSPFWVDVLGVDATNALPSSLTVRDHVATRS